MSKYKNRTFYDSENRFWHSQGENQRWIQLEALERLGKIKSLRRQVRYPLDLHFHAHGEEYVDSCVWVADFDYVEDGVHISEDFKSSYTEKMPEFARKRRLFNIFYQRDIRIFMAGKGIMKATTRSKIKKVKK